MPSPSITTPRSKPGRRKPRRTAVGHRVQCSAGLEPRTLHTRMGLVISESALVVAVAADRAAGRTIALANGCFDLLHVGHVRYLEGAAAEADRLVVAVNDDRTVSMLKGPGRPILPAADRAEVVAG